MKWLIGILQEIDTLPHIVLMIPPPLFSDGARGLKTDVVRDVLPDAITDLAHRYGCSLLDLRPHFLQVLGQDWVPGSGNAFSVSCDGCDLTAAGHAIIRDAVSSFLGTSRIVSVRPRSPPPPPPLAPPSPPPPPPWDWPNC